MVKLHCYIFSAHSTVLLFHCIKTELVYFYSTKAQLSIWPYAGRGHDEAVLRHDVLMQLPSFFRFAILPVCVEFVCVRVGLPRQPADYDDIRHFFYDSSCSHRIPPSDRRKGENFQRLSYMRRAEMSQCTYGDEINDWYIDAWRPVMTSASCVCCSVCMRSHTNWANAASHDSFLRIWYLKYAWAVSYRNQTARSRTYTSIAVSLLLTITLTPIPNPNHSTF